MGCGVSQDASVKALHSNIRWYEANGPDAEDRMERIQSMRKLYNVRDMDNGNAAIHIAAQNGKIELVKIILSNGGLVNARNQSGNTALHMATEYGMLEVAKLLKDSEADINIKNNDGHAAMNGIEGQKAPL